MTNIQKVLDKASALQELILEKASEICNSGEVSVKELALCSKIVKEVCDTVIKFSLNVNEVEMAVNSSEVREKKPLVKNVYDIMALEDILQEARERFKDDLHLIEHHQNPIDVIKRAKEYINKMIDMPENDDDNSIYEDEGLKFYNNEALAENFVEGNVNEGNFST